MLPTPLSTNSPRVQQSTTNRSRSTSPEGQAGTSAGGGQAAAGMSGLQGRVSRSGSLSPTRASLPTSASRAPSDFGDIDAEDIASADAAAAAAPQHLRDQPNFFLGIQDEPRKAAAFQQKSSEGEHAAWQYIADNVNPNRVYGNALNLGKALFGGPVVMNKNCVYCAKATDQNLAELTGGSPQHFWIAEKTSSGDLPQSGSSNHSPGPDDRISALLAQDIPRGKRAVITVPQRDTKDYNHAMNVVHAGDGSIHVIDGQNSKVYNLSLEADRQSFDEKFGHNGGTSHARFFTTGDAPRIAGGEWGA